VVIVTYRAYSGATPCEKENYPLITAIRASHLYNVESRLIVL